MKIQADKQKIGYKNIYRQINKRMGTKMQAEVQTGMGKQNINCMYNR